MEIEVEVGIGCFGEFQSLDTMVTLAVASVGLVKGQVMGGFEVVVGVDCMPVDLSCLRRMTLNIDGEWYAESHSQVANLVWVPM